MNNYVFLPWKDNAVVHPGCECNDTVGHDSSVVRPHDFRPGGPGFESHWHRFRTSGQCLSEVTLKAVGAFYLVSMPGEVKDPTQRVNV